MTRTDWGAGSETTSPLERAFLELIGSAPAPEAP